MERHSAVSMGKIPTVRNTDSFCFDQQKKHRLAEYEGLSLEIVTLKGAFWKQVQNRSFCTDGPEEIECFGKIENSARKVKRTK